MRLRFGTDGVRGDAEEELTPKRMVALGRAIARVFRPDFVVIGRDTRLSGERIERDLARGLHAEGVRVGRLSVAPTPAVAWSSAHRGVPGIAVSGSHNHWKDNGVKVFAPGGLKLDDATQSEIEQTWWELENDDVEGPELQPAPAVDLPEDLVGYRDSLVASVEGRRFDGIDVVLDCANGAAFEIAPDIISWLGARVFLLNAKPDGRNINEKCGSTHPEVVSRAVVRCGADVGFAFDGDADRVIASDEQGRVVDGDQIIAMCAIDLRDRGRLKNDTVAVTVMSNLGLRMGLRATAIEVVDTPVGDRYVLEELDKRGLSLGGEQSGHIIFRDLATTGDGILTALQVLDLMARTGRYLSDIAETSMTKLPQVLRNVRCSGRDPAIVEKIRPVVEREERLLGDGGRVLVRMSGTEPVVRVMVEAPTERMASEVAERIVQAVQSQDGG
ncbi:MAG: phosphoglucosamine mutase [Acidimicrobiales bacterium]|nr:MAG: phosphoglucosamine mutase [Acidimicrobiales bacterium]